MALPDKIYLPDRRNYSNAVYPSDSMDWLGTALGAAGGLFSSFFSNRSINKQIKAQQRENELNRQFNSAEAQKSRDFASLMFDRENAYNDPKAVIQRLQSAGINPALAYGSFADSSSISSNASASSSGSITPGSLDTSGIVSAGRSYLDSRIAESQASLNEAQAENIRSHTAWVDRLNTVTEKLGLGEVDYRGANTKFVLKQFEDLEFKLKELNPLIKQITGEQLKQSFSETHIKKVAASWADTRQLAEIKKLFSEVKLNDQQAVRIAAVLSAEVADLYASARLKNASASIQEFLQSLNEERKRVYGLEFLSSQDVDYMTESIRSLYYGSDRTRRITDLDENRFGWEQTETFIDAFKSLLDVGTDVYNGHQHRKTLKDIGPAHRTNITVRPM